MDYLDYHDRELIPINDAMMQEQMKQEDGLCKYLQQTVLL